MTFLPASLYCPDCPYSSWRRSLPLLLSSFFAPVRTSRTTVWPSRTSEFVSAVPTSPLDPAITTFMDSPSISGQLPPFPAAMPCPDFPRAFRPLAAWCWTLPTKHATHSVRRGQDGASPPKVWLNAGATSAGRAPRRRLQFLREQRNAVHPGKGSVLRPPQGSRGCSGGTGPTHSPFPRQVPFPHLPSPPAA